MNNQNAAVEFSYAGFSATKGGKITDKHCTMQILCHVLSIFFVRLIFKDLMS